MKGRKSKIERGMKFPFTCSSCGTTILYNACRRIKVICPTCSRSLTQKEIDALLAQQVGAVFARRERQ